MQTHGAPDSLRSGRTRRPPLHKFGVNLRTWLLHAIIFPLGVTRMAVPSFALNGHGDSQERAEVGDGAIEFFEVHIQRLALRAAGLFVESHAVHVHAFENWFLKQLAGGFRVLGVDAKFHSSDEVGDEPIQAHQVVVAQKALNPRRLQASFRQERFRKVTELANGHQLAEISLFAGFRRLRWNLQMSPIQFIFQGFPCSFGERFRFEGELQQFAIAHGGVDFRQAAALFGLVRI
jgi:hypothetical protein